MSRVVSGTPHAGLGAAELAGEQGGAPCDTGRGVPSGALITAAAFAAWRRRGRAALVAAAVAAPTIASAADSEPPPFWKQHDLGPQHGNFEVRYGSVRFEDPDFDQIYDDSNPRTLEVQFGPQFWRVLELDVGLGLIQKKTTTEYQGLDSTENVLFTAIPLTMDGTLRLQFIDEQLLVPYGRAGLDYFVWNERSSYDDLNPIFGIPEVPTTTTTDTGSSASAATVEKISGSKMGVHWGFGGGLLLDVFAPNRASLLEAQTGVNDTYLTFDWRRQVIDDRSAWWKTGTSDGLIFNGTAFTVGLKLDY